MLLCAVDVMETMVQRWGGKTLSLPFNLQEGASQRVLGFPGGSVVKYPAANAGDVGLIPGSGRSLEGGNGNPLQYSCWENSMNRGAWRAYSLWGHKESDTQSDTVTHRHSDWAPMQQGLALSHFSIFLSISLPESVLLFTFYLGWRPIYLESFLFVFYIFAGMV